jgi:hypothetical protein
MPKIFISYRREDAPAHAGRLYDHLSNHFGAEQIFMDVDTIQPGDDFVKAIEDAVGACDILIALIGDQWLTSTGKGSGRRLDNPDDFVRLEIVTALKRNIRTIPVLVEGATIPQLKDLPDELRTLSRRNAIEVRDTTWRQDVTSLIKAIEKSSSPQDPVALAPKQSVLSKFLRDRRFALGFGVLIIAVISLILWLQFARRDNRPTRLGSNANKLPSPSLSSTAGALPTRTRPASPTPTVSTEGAGPEIYSKGKLTIRGTWSCDLDIGAETSAGEDFWWSQQTETRRYIVPKNGAKFSVIGGREFDSITYSDLRRASYSTEAINGSDALYNRIPQGTVVAFITSEGRYGKFRVDNYGYNLAISWITYSSNK